MDTETKGDWAPEQAATEEEAEGELDRILSDPEFHCTERNKRFLRFVSDEVFRGRGDAIKAYTIAVDVFGRPPSFDPTSDPIVRIEATRLRAALAHYYELHPPHNGIRIELPKGRYVPAFYRSAMGGPPNLPIEPTAAPRESSRRRRTWLFPTDASRWLSGGLGVSGGALVALLLVFAPSVRRPAEVMSQKPSVAIELRASGGVVGHEAIAVRDALMVALSDFQTLRISAPDAITGSTGNVVAVMPPDDNRHRYRLLLKFDSGAGGTSLWWQVVDGDSGEVLRSGAERVDPWRPQQSSERIAAQLAVRLASSQGVINTLETSRELDSPTLGHGCVLRAALALESREPQALAQARDCLERTLAARESDADAHAMLAAVLLRIDSPDAPTQLTERAVGNAARAVALAPDSDRSFYAQMIAQFRIGNAEAAILAGRRALELNPNNPMTAGKLANVLFVTGHWDEGAALARTAKARDILSREADATLAFDAYRQGRYEEALLILKQLNSRDCYCLQVLKVATLGKLGRFDEVNAAVAELRRLRPRFESSLHADLARRHFSPGLIAILQEGLQKAGLRIA